MNLTLVSNSSEDENTHSLSESETLEPWITIRFENSAGFISPDVKARVARIMLAAAVSALQQECRA